MNALGGILSSTYLYVLRGLFSWGKVARNGNVVSCGLAVLKAVGFQCQRPSLGSELPPTPPALAQQARHVVRILRSSLSPGMKWPEESRQGNERWGGVCARQPRLHPGPPVPTGLSLFPPLPLPATSVSFSVSPPFLSTPKRAVCKVCINAVFDICYSKGKKRELVLVLLTRLFKAFAFV